MLDNIAMPRTLSDTPAAVRKRRQLDRARCGVSVVTMEVAPDLIRNMIDIGVLEMRDGHDRRAIARALLDLAERAVEDIKSAARPANARAPSRLSDRATTSSRVRGAYRQG